MIQLLTESLVPEDQKIIVESKQIIEVEKEKIIEVDKINERIIERPVIVEKEKIVLVPDGRTNELNKHLVDIIGQIEVLKDIIKENANKIIPKTINYDSKFNEVSNTVNQNSLNIMKQFDSRVQTIQETIIQSRNVPEKQKLEVKDYTDDLNGLNFQLKQLTKSLSDLKDLPVMTSETYSRLNIIDLKLQELSKPKPLSIKVEEISNLKELPTAIQFLMSDVKELPFKVENLSKQINQIKELVTSIQVKPELKVETKEVKIDLSSIESRLEELLNEVTKPIQFPEQEKLNFGIDDLVSIINHVKLMNASIEKTIDEKYLQVVQNLEAVINSSFASFKNLLRVIPDKHEVEVNVIDNEKVITLLDSINLQTANILNNQENEKELVLEFASFETIPKPDLWKGKTVLVHRVKRKYWFDKKNVLYYSTGFRWVRL